MKTTVKDKNLQYKLLDTESENNLFTALEYSERLILFIGAGLSKDTGIPTWKKLLGEIYLKAFGKEIEIEDGDELKIASQLEKQCVVKKIGFYDEIKRIINGRKLPHLAVHEHILKADFFSRITTNFDNVLDSAATGTLKNYNPQYWPRFRISHINTDCTCYLHGNVFVNDINNRIIFTEESYKEAYEETDYIKRLLSAITYENNILFAGFSFNDFEFVALFEKIFTMKKDEMWAEFGPHFILLPSSLREAEYSGYKQKYHDFLIALNVKPIYFIVEGDSYINLHHILDYFIRKMKKPQLLDGTI
ncbi:SIR2 family protein [bacterium]|nr:SIR2 family protein [bacterium]MBU1633951.1 SIR2 family protein [bacterium]MBU1875197.1 SIR2 family protein [bacterium]